MIQILIVDDHAILRRGLKEILEREFRDVRIGGAGTAEARPVRRPLSKLGGKGHRERLLEPRDHPSHHSGRHGRRG